MIRDGLRCPPLWIPVIRLHRATTTALPRLRPLLQRACASLVLIQHPGLLTSRYSIQFGKSPARLGRTRVLGENQVDHDQVGIPQVLKRANPKYQAAHLGKWHIDADPSRYLYDVHDGQTTNKEGVMIMIRKPNGAATARPIRNESLV